MMMKVDLNSDLGESFGAYTIGLDDQVLSYITSANIACGYHAGDPNVMSKTVRMAKEHDVGVGAHPGLPDLHGFGRRMMDITPDDAYHLTLYQIGALQAFCTANKVELQHVKPHGALYNMAAKNEALANAIAKAVKEINPSLILFGLANSKLIQAGEELGLKTASEVFADRTYQDDGTLTPRSQDNAVIEHIQDAEKQVIHMIKEQKVKTVNGKEIPIKADSICVHGDKDSALLFVKKLRERLTKENIQIKRIGD